MKGCVNHRINRALDAVLSDLAGAEGLRYDPQISSPVDRGIFAVRLSVLEDIQRATLSVESRLQAIRGTPRGAIR